MTIFFPDLSHWDHDRGLVQLEPDTVAVIAKASHGIAFVDPQYQHWRDEAARVGAAFSAYHWLNDGNATAQAAYCHAVVGDIPVMVDAEDVAGNTGFVRDLTIADITGFITAMRRYGGRVWGVYLPRWYWHDRMGGPDLSPLQQLGIALVASNYSRYADDGPGWSSYGSMTPAVWQYANKLSYGGNACDFNAFRGTVDQFRALLTGDQEMMTLDELDGIKIPGTDSTAYGARSLAQIAGDAQTVRNILVGEIQPDDPRYPHPDSPLGRLLALLEHPPTPAGTPTQQQVTEAIRTLVREVFSAWLATVP